MHALIWRVTIKEPVEANRILHQEIVPAISQTPGFAGGYWAETEDGHGTAMVLFNSEADARRVADMPEPQTDAFDIEVSELAEIVAQA